MGDSDSMRRGVGGAVGGLALLLLLSLFPGPLHPLPLLAQDPAAEYEALLGKCVKKDGIDYAALAAGRAPLDAFVRSLETADPGATGPDRIAFWINAYNALTLQQVLDTRTNSVMDEKGFFDGRTWMVAGREVTLDGIEKGILRDLKEPLVPFALHRAARSCPPLSGRLYGGKDLSETLTQQARAYLADEKQNRFSEARLSAELSMIFLWYREEFEARHEGTAAPLQFFLADYMPRETIARSLRKGVWRLTFKPCDWTLDEVGGGRRGGAHPVWTVLYGIAALALLLLGFRAFKTLLWRRRG